MGCHPSRTPPNKFVLLCEAREGATLGSVNNAKLQNKEKKRITENEKKKMGDTLKVIDSLRKSFKIEGMDDLLTIAEEKLKDL